MIIPSVDLQKGHAVQLERGRELKIDAGDPRPIAEKIGRVGEIAVIDLDAAMGTGSNAETIEDLLRLAPCRVGGGIRDVDSAIRWLDAGARRVILGTAARPEILRELPRERTIAALDAEHGEVVTHGWKTRSGRSLEDAIGEVAEHVGGFLITFVEREGTMTGLDLDRAARLKELVGDRRLTVAGGVADAEEIGRLDALGIDAQIGMALYSGRFSLADAVAACLTSDRPDGLWPTVVSDEHGRTLGMTYSNRDSLHAALEEGRGVYHSRSRGLWRKGESSGATQELLAVRADCDRDALMFRVRQTGAGFCHLKTRTCFGEDDGLTRLARRLADPATRAAPGSYTARLFEDPELLAKKLVEEAHELVDAGSEDEIVHEASDLIFFTLVRLAEAGVPLEAVERHLDRKALKVKRRKGDAKPGAADPRKKASDDA
ncbi:MAG: phosphoribosyl-ATP diphosphatase [Planctomycetota bacterium]